MKTDEKSQNKKAKKHHAYKQHLHPASYQEITITIMKVADFDKNPSNCNNYIQ